jgi:NADH-quinone oxidoreductase subunit M
MDNWPVLLITTFLPLVGAGFILLIRGEEQVVARNARYVALWTSLVTFFWSLLVYFSFDPRDPGFQLKSTTEWLPGMNFALGIDGISLWFVLLSTFLTPICVLASWDSVQKRVKEYMIAFLVLETMMVGMFCALNLFVFYIFFEGVLIPMFLIIGVWGGERRVYASFKFFLYTFLGSVLLLVAIIAIYLSPTDTARAVVPGSFAGIGLPWDGEHPWRNLQTWLFIGFFASFAVKVPMWPVHTWLPDAHVEAPTAGSVILAGVLLKMGGYGFLRLSLPIAPEASAFFTPLVFVLSGVAIIYTSAVALAQTDFKKLIAYSSVAHMGFVTMGIFAAAGPGGVQGVTGAVFQMLSHGIVSAALFLVVGVVYDRLHTRDLSKFGGLASTMPRYAVFAMIFTLGSVGLPGTSGFVGEFLSLLGGYLATPWIGVPAALGVVLGAVYMLSMYRRVFFGEMGGEHLRGLKDLSPREIAIFLPMAALVIWMGVYPQTFLEPMAQSIEQLVTNYARVVGG